MHVENTIDWKCARRQRNDSYNLTNTVDISNVLNEEIRLRKFYTDKSLKAQWTEENSR